MNVKHVLVVMMLATKLASVHCSAWAILGIAESVLGIIIAADKIANNSEMWIVEVHNEGKDHAHMWCASRDDKIGGDDGLWVPPGKKIAWAFRKHSFTQFWCKMDWYGQRVSWDVFVGNWKDAPNPTKWSIRNDGVYDQWKNRIWRKYDSYLS